MGEYLLIYNEVKKYLYQKDILKAKDRLQYLLNLLNDEMKKTSNPLQKNKNKDAIIKLLPALDDLKKNQISERVITILNLDHSLLKNDDKLNEKIAQSSKTPNNETKKEEKVELVGKALRPQLLKDYIGQTRAVATLMPPIKKARLTSSALPHILLCGSYGQGKTTLAKIIANEMEGEFIELPASIKSKDLLRTLRKMKPNSIIFIDEVHKLSNEVVETLLYPAMEDFEVHFVEGNGLRIQNVTQKISQFTLIGATTESGKLLKPFYSKFPIKITLEEYTNEIIATIIKNSFTSLGMKISDNGANNIAKRSRILPRLANAFVEGIASSALVKYAEDNNITQKGFFKSNEEIKKLNIQISDEIIEQYFLDLEIDENGLNKEDKLLLEIIIKNYNGGPVGLESIAKTLNVAPNRVDQEYEPYLTKLGLINVRPQGRFATEKAYKLLNIPFDNENKTDEEVKEDKSLKIKEDDEIKEINFQIEPLNLEKSEQILKLFSGSSNKYSQELDELFQDIEKDYESTAQNKYLLNLSNGRKVYCDSKLERRFIMYLCKYGIIKDVKSEAIKLYYSSKKSDNKVYYPDFILKLFNDEIVILEMKSLATMGYHLNIEKYEALQNFALENNYKYAEIGKNEDLNKYVSFFELTDQVVNQELEEKILKKIESNGECSLKDLESFNANYSDLLTILYKNVTIKNVDRIGNNPKIVLNENIDI